MAYPTYIREKARQLRSEKKLTIDELAERLAIPRTTIYGWVRDLEIPRKPNIGWPESARRKANRATRAKYGVLTVSAGDTYFREAMQAWTDCLRDTWLNSTPVGA
jgi:predicted DNA-binding transcriptional regulator AlpA